MITAPSTVRSLSNQFALIDVNSSSQTQVINDQFWCNHPEANNHLTPYVSSPRNQPFLRRSKKGFPPFRDRDVRRSPSTSPNCSVSFTQKEVACLLKNISNKKIVGGDLLKPSIRYTIR